MLRRFLPFLIIPVMFVLALVVVSCSSTTTASSDQGSVTMQSQLTASDVEPMIVSHTSTGKDQTQDLTSITVTSVHVFIKDVKLHSDADDLNHDVHDGEIKTGPFVLLFDSLGAHIITTTTIPPATYDRIKFEIHKPDEHDAADAAVLSAFPEFAIGNQTYTVIIQGYTVTNGVRSYFTVRSNASQNITLKFEDKDFADQNNIVINGGTTTLLALEFDPRIVFHLSGAVSGGQLFDPHDTSHQGDIDSHVLIALRLVKIS